MKYIDVDRLRAEINERTLFYAGQANLLTDTTTLDGFDEVLSIIYSLQQEVDLEEELEQYARNHPADDVGSYRNLIGIASHFYKLGQNCK